MKKSDLKIFVKIPTQYTERLVLRKIEVSDLDDVYEYASDFEVSRYLMWRPHKDTAFTHRYLKYLQKLYKGQAFYDWAITYKGKMIGTVGFTSFDLANNSAEIGYVLNRSYWKLGIATEAVKEIINFGFTTLGLNRIQAVLLPENENSKKLLLRVGMKSEGIHKKALFIKDEYKDIEICALLSEDYKKSVIK